MVTQKKVSDLTSTELMTQRKQYKSYTFMFGIVTLLLLLAFVYVAVVAANYALIGMVLGAAIPLLLSASYLKALEREIDNRKNKKKY